MAVIHVPRRHKIISPYSYVDYDSAPAQGLLMWLPLTEGGGDTLYDLSKNRLVGTLVGSSRGWTPGKSGPAISLAGLSSYAAIPHQNKVGLRSGDGSYTVLARMRIDQNTTSNYPRILSWKTVGDSYAAQFGLRARTYYWYPPTGGSSVALQCPAPDYAEHHIAIVYDNTTYRMLINGAKATSTPVSLPILTSDTTTLYVGVRDSGGAGPTTGNLTDFRIYNRALSDAEIQAAYTREDFLQLVPKRTQYFFPVSGGTGDVSVNASGSQIVSASGTPISSHDKVVSGASTTANAGVVGKSIDKVLAGSSTVTNIGSLGKSRDKALSGSAVATAVGSLTKTRDKPIAGSSTTTAAGTLTPVISTATALAGSAVTTAAGTLTHTALTALTGDEAATAVGTVTAVAGSGATVALSGAEVTTAAGTLTHAATTALTGAEATTAAGTVTAVAGFGATVALTGSAVATAADTLTHTATTALTGDAATTAAGTVTAVAGSGATVALTGAEATTATGTLAHTATTALTGSAVTTTAGTVTPTIGVTAALFGSEVTTATDTLTHTAATALTGDEATTAAGTIGAGADKVVALVGDTVSVSAGTFLAGLQLAATGSQATTSYGTLLGATDLGLTGIAVGALAGTITTTGGISTSGEFARTVRGVRVHQAVGDLTVKLSAEDVRVNLSPQNARV